jgi:hypothetical protein
MSKDLNATFNELLKYSKEVSNERDEYLKDYLQEKAKEAAVTRKKAEEEAAARKKEEEEVTRKKEEEKKELALKYLKDILGIFNLSNTLDKSKCIASITLFSQDEFAKDLWTTRGRRCPTTDVNIKSVDGSFYTPYEIDLDDVLEELITFYPPDSIKEKLKQLSKITCNVFPVLYDYLIKLSENNNRYSIKGDGKSDIIIEANDNIDYNVPV